MTKKDKVKLENAMTGYLQLKALTQSQERQLEALKEQALEVVARYPDDWCSGVFAVEGVGVIKEMLNPPKVVFTSTGQALNDIETVGLLAELGTIYTRSVVNVTRLRDVVQRGDRDVLAVLAKHGVVCVQEKRLDIKKA